MAEIDRLSVKLDWDLSAFRRGARDASREVSNLSSAVDRMSSRGQSNVTQLTNSFNRLTSAIKDAQDAARRGAQFNVRVDDRQLRTLSSTVRDTRRDIERGATFRISSDVRGMQDIRNAIRDARNDANNGATFRVTADVAGMQQIRDALSSARNDANDGATFRVTADTEGLQGIRDALQSARDDANNGSTFRIAADTEGLQSVHSALQAARDDANNGATFRITVDNAGLQAVQGALQQARTAAETPVTFQIVYDNSALSTLQTEIQQLRGDIEQGAVFTIQGDTSGLATVYTEVNALRAEFANDVVMRFRAEFDGGAATTEMQALKAEASDGATMHINADADTAGATAKMAELEQQRERIDGKNINIAANVDQSLASVLPNALGSVEAQLANLQVVTQAWSQVQLPMMLTRMAGISGAATGAAAGLSSFAYELGTGVVGAAALAGEALAAGGVALYGYGLAQREAIDSAFNLNDAIKKQNTERKYANQGVKEAQKLVDDAIPGTQEYADAQTALAFAQSDAAFQQEKMASILRGVTPNMMEAQSAAQDFQLALMDVGNAAADSASPALTHFLQMATDMMPALTPMMQTVIEGMNQVAIQFMDTATSGLQLQNVQNILSLIGEAGVPAMQALAAAGHTAIAVLGTGAPFAEELLNSIQNLAMATSAWMTSAEGTQTLITIWAELREAGAQVYQIVLSISEGLMGLGIAISEMTIGQELLDQIQGMADRFRDLMAAGGEGREAVVSFGAAASPALLAVLPALEQIGGNFLELARRVVTATDSVTGMNVMQEIIESLGNVSGPIMQGLAQEFERIGPLIPPLIEVLGEWFRLFVVSTPEMSLFIQALTGALQIFQTLPDPIQQAVTRGIAWLAVIQMMGGGAVASATTSIAGLVGSFLMWRRLGNMQSELQNICRAIEGTGVCADTAGGKIDKFKGVLRGLATFAAAGALAAIAIDFIVNAPDIKSAFEQTKSDLEAEGQTGIGVYLDAMAAGLDQTWIGANIGRPIGTAIAEGIKQAGDPEQPGGGLASGAMPSEAGDDTGFAEKLQEKLAGIDWAAVSESLMRAMPGGGLLADIIFGPDEGAVAIGDKVREILGGIDWAGAAQVAIGMLPGGSLINSILFGGEDTDPGTIIMDKLSGAWEAVTEWLGGLVPDINLWDILTGGNEEGGGTGFAGILIPGLEEAWASVTEWLGSLVPDINLMDVLFGAVETGGDIVSGILETLAGVWESVTGWLAGLVPEINLLDVLFGAVEAGGDIVSGILETLAGVWESITGWLGGLVPEISLMDIILGAGQAAADLVSPVLDALNSLWEQVTTIWESIKTSVSDAMNYIWNDVIVSTWESIKTSVSDAMNYIWNDIIVSTWESIKTSVLDAMNYIWNDIIVATWESIKTSIYDAMQYIWNDIIIATWEEIKTTLYDAMQYIWNDIIVATWEEIKTTLYDAMQYIWNDIIVATWEEIKTTLYDAMQYIWNDIIVATWEEIKTTLYDAMQYIWNDIIIATWEEIKTTLYDAMQYIWNDIIVATWESIKTSIYDAMQYIWNDIIVATWESIKTSVTEAMEAIKTGISDAWEAIKSGASSFGTAFANLLHDAFATAVNAGLDALQGLLSGIDAVLGAIGASPLGIDVTSYKIGMSGEAAEDGLVKMASGGSRGGVGHPGKHSTLVEWDEGYGTEYWIATGGPRRDNIGYLSSAAQDFGFGLAPMAHGGYMGTGGPVIQADTGLWSADVEPIVEDIQSKFGVNATTYSTHGSEHYIPNIPENTADFWTSDPALHAAITDYILSTYGSVLDTMISMDYLWGPALVGYGDWGHYDHVHAGFYGGGGGAVGGGSSGSGSSVGSRISALISKAKSMWDSLVSSLNFDIGSGPLWSAVSDYLKTLPEMAWKWIASKMPAGRVGGGSIDLGSISGDVLDIAKAGIKQMGWDESEINALEQLWMGESGWDPNIVNPDSGAYGIPQINPAAHGYPAPIGDAPAQIEWGLNYIAGRYGTPTAALENYNTFGGYAQGGVQGTVRGSDSNLHTQTGPRGAAVLAGIRGSGAGIGKTDTYMPPDFPRIPTNQSNIKTGGMEGGGTISDSEPPFPGRGGGFNERFLPEYQKGGLVPGNGQQPILAHGGERVLPPDVTASFDALVQALAMVTGGAGEDPTQNPIVGLQETLTTVGEQLTTPLTEMLAQNTDDFLPIQQAMLVMQQEEFLPMAQELYDYQTESFFPMQEELYALQTEDWFPAQMESLTYLQDQGDVGVAQQATSNQQQLQHIAEQQTGNAISAATTQQVATTNQIGNIHTSQLNQVGALQASTIGALGSGFGATLQGLSALGGVMQASIGVLSNIFSAQMAVVGHALGGTLGGRGGTGGPGRNPKTVVWDEGMGTEWWIASGGPRGDNLGRLSDAASAFGYGLVPMASGGVLFAQSGLTLSDTVTQPGYTPIVNMKDIGTQTGDNISVTMSGTITGSGDSGSSGGGGGGGTAGGGGAGMSPCQCCAQGVGGVGKMSAAGGGTGTSMPTSNSMNISGQSGYGGSGPQVYQNGPLIQIGNTTNFKGGSSNFHRGGVIPGFGDKMIQAQGGERILPRGLNRGFENLSASIDRWRAMDDAGPRRGGADVDLASVEEKLENVEKAIDRMANNPTPVDINNPGDLERAFVAGVHAGLSSDDGKDIMDGAVAEFIGDYRKMNFSGGR